MSKNTGRVLKLVGGSESVRIERPGGSEWTEFRTVNDPASGKTVQNQGHAGDDWADFEAVNDPASGKTVQNQGHAA